MGTELVPETLYLNELTRLCALENYIEVSDMIMIGSKECVMFMQCEDIYTYEYNSFYFKLCDILFYFALQENILRSHGRH
jgi:hypothetical protein